jgi:hypothetical protein
VGLGPGAQPGEVGGAFSGLGEVREQVDALELPRVDGLADRAEADLVSDRVTALRSVRPIQATRFGPCGSRHKKFCSGQKNL